MIFACFGRRAGGITPALPGGPGQEWRVRVSWLPTHPLDAIKGGDATYNAAALRDLLTGATGAYRDTVVFNAAAALIVAGEAADLRTGAEEAAEAIDKGLAKALLDCWINMVNSEASRPS